MQGDEDDQRPVLLVVMGTSGCGKSTFGTALAQSLSIPFVDGDDLHPKHNVEKMSRGEALNDEDRLPWLRSIREKAIQLTHPIHGQSASQRERSSKDEPREEEERIREMAEVFETSRQGGRKSGDADGGQNEDAMGAMNKSVSTSRACVIACSALKKSYRDLLRGEGADFNDLRVIHIYMKVEAKELLRRMHERKGHFMKESMLQSQLATLEDPTGEKDTIVVEEGKPDVQVQKTKEQLESMVYFTL